MSIRPAILDNESRVAVFMPNQKDLIDLIRQVPKSRWSPSHGCWHFPKTEKYWVAFKDLFKDFDFNIQKDMIPLSIPAVEMFEIPKLTLKADYVAVAQLSKGLERLESSQASSVQENISVISRTEQVPFQIEKVSFDEQTFMSLPIPYTDTISRESIKKIEGRFWHPQQNAWLLPYNQPTYNKLVQAFGDKLILPTTTTIRAIMPPVSQPQMTIKTENRKVENTSLFDKLNEQQQMAVTKLEHLLILERKAEHTRKGYRNIFIQFLTHYIDVLPSRITAEQISDYILHRVKDEKISKSTQNHIISTLKAFYSRILEHHAKVSGLYRPNKEEHLPKELEPVEVVKLFAQVGNIKHKCLLMLMYGSGLRVGEAVRLKWQDLDFEEKTVFVHNGKNYKDRYTILSDKAIQYLQKYQAQYATKDWVFESPTGEHYSERSVQLFFAEALAKAHIDKPLSTHSLRHGFATQLLKANTDLDFVRKVMGHASIKTTQIYLHVVKTELTKTKSPLDNLNI